MFPCCHLLCLRAVALRFENSCSTTEMPSAQRNQKDLRVSAVSLLAMLHVVHSLAKERRDMLVVERVVDGAARPAPPDQLQLTQHTQLV